MSALPSVIVESRPQEYGTMRPMLLFLQARSVRPRSCMFTDLAKKYRDVQMTAQLEKWRWVSINEIETCVSDKRPICEWTPQELMERFILINRMRDGKGLATWISEYTCAIESEVIPATTRMMSSDTYLPQKWADAIVELYGQGVLRLKAGNLYILAEMRDGDTRVVFPHEKGQCILGPRFSNVGDR